MDDRARLAGCDLTVLGGFLFGNLWQTRLARAVHGDLDDACARAGLDKIKDQLK